MVRALPWCHNQAGWECVRAEHVAAELQAVPTDVEELIQWAQLAALSPAPGRFPALHQCSAHPTLMPTVTELRARLPQ